MQELIQQVRDILRSMWLQRWWGLIVGVTVGLLAGAATFLISDKHEATARVYVDTQSILKPLMTGLAVQPNVEQQVAMMGRTLISRPNVERVVRMADLDLRVKTRQQREGMLDQLMKDIKFEATGGRENIYTITFRDQMPQTAKKVVQSLLSIFVEANLGDKRRDTDQARRFIEDQIKTYEQRLLKSEDALKEFKIRNIQLMPNLAKDYVAQTSEMQNMATQARLELRQAQYARDALRSQLSGEAPTMGPLPGEPGTNTSSPTADLEKRVDAQKRKLDELRTRFTDAHPDVIAARQILGQMRAQLESERTRLASNPVAAQAAQRANPVFQQLRLALADAEAQVAALRARVADYDSRLTKARQAAATIPKVEAEYIALTRDYQVNKKNYEQLLARRDSVQMSGEMEAAAGVAEFRIVDPPRVSAKPVWPNRPLLLGLALMMSIVAGFGAAFLRAQLKPVFLDARSLRDITEMPLLGSVSLLMSSRGRARNRNANLAFSGSVLMYTLLFFGAIAYFVLKAAGK
ncbi:MAG: chain length-determining protein [Burkholderiaceae bacterium]|nr:chain length-determining protein [Burkholderiaceae bacterium]